jgi:hypothetical protein
VRLDEPHIEDIYLEKVGAPRIHTTPAAQETGA